MKKIFCMAVVGLLAISVASVAFAGRAGSGGVKDVYDGGVSVGDGTTRVIVCNDGGKMTIYRYGGKWKDYGTMSEFGYKYNDMSLNEVASDVCQ